MRRMDWASLIAGLLEKRQATAVKRSSVLAKAAKRSSLEPEALRASLQGFLRK